MVVEVQSALVEVQSVVVEVRSASGVTNKFWCACNFGGEKIWRQVDEKGKRWKIEIKKRKGNRAVANQKKKPQT